LEVKGVIEGKRRAKRAKNRRFLIKTNYGGGFTQSIRAIFFQGTLFFRGTLSKKSNGDFPLNIFFMDKEKKKRLSLFRTGIWKNREFIRNKMERINMNDVEENKAWAMCLVQKMHNICTSAMLNILSDYSISKSSFYQAKRKLFKGVFQVLVKQPFFHLNSGKWLKCK
jgi:hypothetical protein